MTKEEKRIAREAKKFFEREKAHYEERMQIAAETEAQAAQEIAPVEEIADDETDEESAENSEDKGDQ